MKMRCWCTATIWKSLGLLMATSSTLMSFRNHRMCCSESISSVSGVNCPARNSSLKGALSCNHTASAGLWRGRRVENQIHWRWKFQVGTPNTEPSAEDTSDTNSSGKADIDIQLDMSSSTEEDTFPSLPFCVPWDGIEVTTTMMTYFGVLHGPLGVGGLSLVAHIVGEEKLDPQTKAMSLLLLEVLELAGATSLFRSSLKQYEPFPEALFRFELRDLWRNERWVLATSIGLLVLFSVMGATSSIFPCVKLQDIEHQSALQELMEGNLITKLDTFLVSCLITPYLEEYIYRAFLLSSLSSWMPWPLAIVVSSGVFAFAHLSPSGTASLFFIGCLLGFTYLWTGSLASSFVVHSIYNMVILVQLWK